MSLQYGECRPTNGWDRFGSLGHPRKFQRVSRLGFVTASTSVNGCQPNFVRCLAVFCAGTLYIHFWGLLSPNGTLLGAKFSLRPTHAFSCIGSVTVWHLRSGREPNFAAWYKESNYRTFVPRHFQQRAPPIFPRASITFGIGPHSSLWFICYVHSKFKFTLDCWHCIIIIVIIIIIATLFSWVMDYAKCILVTRVCLCVCLSVRHRMPTLLDSIIEFSQSWSQTSSRTSSRARSRAR